MPYPIRVVAAPNGISCPSSAMCVVADSSGNVVVSKAPASGARSWKVSHVQGAGSFTGISCPTTSFCAAADSSGDIATSTNPAGGAAAWMLVHVDTRFVPVLRRPCGTAGTGCVFGWLRWNLVRFAPPVRGGRRRGQRDQLHAPRRWATLVEDRQNRIPRHQRWRSPTGNERSFGARLHGSARSSRTVCSSLRTRVTSSRVRTQPEARPVGVQARSLATAYRSSRAQRARSALPRRRRERPQDHEPHRANTEMDQHPRRRWQWWDRPTTASQASPAQPPLYASPRTDAGTRSSARPHGHAPDHTRRHRRQTTRRPRHTSTACGGEQCKGSRAAVAVRSERLSGRERIAVAFVTNEASVIWGHARRLFSAQEGLHHTTSEARRDSEVIGIR